MSNEAEISVKAHSRAKAIPHPDRELLLAEGRMWDTKAKEYPNGSKLYRWYKAKAQICRTVARGHTPRMGDV